MQNTVIKTVIGAYRISPGASILCEANEPPVHLKKVELNLIYVAKLAGKFNKRNYL